MAYAESRDMSNTKEIIDYMKMPKKTLWALVDSTDTSNLAALWEAAHKKILDREAAIDLLNLLFLDSHKRIKANSAVLAKNYPTVQFYKNTLQNVNHLWWVDHFTGGYNHWSTLNWFSAGLNKKAEDGTMHLAEASTHFVMGFHGLPFYIIPLCHAAWHVPARNKDSIGIEYVNVGPVESVSDASGMHFKGAIGNIPASVVQELAPVVLATPFRGAKIMMPFTQDQIIASIILKRVVIAALPDRFDLSRMSQHTEWNPHKFDMGPLWPFDEINQNAFSPEPVQEMSLVQRLEDFVPPEERKPITLTAHIENTDAFDRGQATDEPAHTTLPIDRIQTLLNTIGTTPRLTVSGVMDKATKNAVRLFQLKWNQTHEDKLVVDGIPGPLTGACLVTLAGTF